MKQIEMPLGMRRSAVLEEPYRYTLTRDWCAPHDEVRAVLWVMLNPSIANGYDDDATIRRILGFSRQWGYNVALVGNLYAAISTDPRALGAAKDPVGPKNDEWLDRLAARAEKVVCAWGDGVPKGAEDRIRSVMTTLARHHAQLFALGFTSAGRPRHPVRLAYATPLTPIRGRTAPLTPSLEREST